MLLNVDVKLGSQYKERPERLPQTQISVIIKARKFFVAALEDSVLVDETPNQVLLKNKIYEDVAGCGGRINLDVILAALKKTSEILTLTRENRRCLKQSFLLPSSIVSSIVGSPA